MPGPKDPTAIALAELETADPTEIPHLFHGKHGGHSPYLCTATLEHHPAITVRLEWGL